MTTNAQGLTFGEWLAQAGFSPDRFANASKLLRDCLHDDWTEGRSPWAMNDLPIRTQQ